VYGHVESMEQNDIETYEFFVKILSLNSAFMLCFHSIKAVL